jgi:hypothetical protein
VAEIVNCDVPDPVAEDGLKDAVAPLGSPDALRLVTPENPFSPVIVALKVAFPPGCSDWLEGDTAKLKSGFGVTPLPVVGSTSTSAKLYSSLVGAASFIATIVPAGEETLFCRCTQ